MKKFLLPLIASFASVFPICAIASTDIQEYTVFSDAVFYDGYNTDKIFDAGLSDGILRHSNSLYATKLDAETLKVMDDIRLEVTIGALCDNYDRMGRVNIAFVPKGAESYNPETTDRVEIARFITPFMNKNKQPSAVPYAFDIKELRHIFSDEDILSEYDLWLETEVFGFPYSANKQIKGCEGRNDVFSATVNFTYTEAGKEVDKEMGKTHLIPLYITKSEIEGPVNFNNYKEQATDSIGVTTRTFRYNVPANLSDAEVYFILTNHGAEDGGEEYERRKHLVYLDGEIAMTYTPGGVSCEPYRKYSTQGNALFDKEREDSFWEEISNWCPGQAVPIRRIALGALTAGNHEIMIRVPDAEFYGQDGDFRPSICVLGVEKGVLQSSGVNSIQVETSTAEFRQIGNTLYYVSPAALKEIAVYTYDGKLVEGCYTSEQTGELELGGYGAGQYIVVLTDKNYQTTTKKIVVK